MPMVAMLRADNEPERRLILALAESQTKLTLTLLVAESLHTRAPTGKYLGPDAGLLLSRPTIFQVNGVIVNVAKARLENKKAKKINTAPAPRRNENKLKRTPYFSRYPGTPEII